MRRVLALGAFGIWGHSQGSVAWGVHPRLPSMQKSGIMVGEARGPCSRRLSRCRRTRQYIESVCRSAAA